MVLFLSHVHRSRGAAGVVALVQERAGPAGWRTPVSSPAGGAAGLGAPRGRWSNATQDACRGAAEAIRLLAGEFSLLAEAALEPAERQ
eukprot:10767324-Alexandrium_andersonii.AAC.1